MKRDEHAMRDREKGDRLFEDVSEGHGSVGKLVDKDRLQFTFEVVQHLQR